MTKIEDFINTYEEKSTKKNYRSHLKLYYEYLKTDPETYFDTQRDYEDDVRRYHKHLKEKKYAKRTRNTHIMLIRGYLVYYDVELPQKFWKSLRKLAVDKGNRSATLDQAPTPEQLRKMLDHASPMMRSITMVLTSSGMRPCELVGMVPNDLHLDHDPPYINLREEITKNHVSRYVFITYEARDSLNAWLRERDAWLERAARKMKNLKTVEKTTDDDRVFPMTVNHITITFNRILKNAELDERDQNTKRKIRTYHLYTTRKYFRSYLTPAIQGGSDIVHALMGHDEYLDAAYRRFNLQQLSKMYKDAMPSIAIYDRQSDLSGINESLKEKDQEITNLQQQVEELMDFKTKYLENLILKHESQLNGKKRKIP